MILLDWDQFVRALVFGTAAYLAFVALQRMTGKRTLSKLNAFDLVVTVAFGSVLATILISGDTALATGLLAFALLMVLQYAATFLSVRWKWAARAIKSEPVLLVEDGRLLSDVARKQRVMEEEILQAIRESGYGSVRDIAAVVLETNGQLSVVPRSQRGDGSALKNLV